MNAETKAIINSIYMNIKRSYYDAAEVLEEETVDYKRGVKDFKELVDESFRPYVDEANNGTGVLEELRTELVKEILNFIKDKTEECLSEEVHSDYELLNRTCIINEVIAGIKERYGIDE